MRKAQNLGQFMQNMLSRAPNLSKGVKNGPKMGNPLKFQFEASNVFVDFKLIVLEELHGGHKKAFVPKNIKFNLVMANNKKWLKTVVFCTYSLPKIYLPGLPELLKTFFLFIRLNI